MASMSRLKQSNSQSGGERERESASRKAKTTSSWIKVFWLFDIKHSALEIWKLWGIRLRANKRKHKAIPPFPPARPLLPPSNCGTQALPFVFGVGVYCFEGMGMVIPVEDAMLNRENFSRILSLVMVIYTTLCVLSGGLGYMAFGNATEVCGKHYFVYFFLLYFDLFGRFGVNVGNSRGRRVLPNRFCYIPIWIVLNSAFDKPSIFDSSVQGFVRSTRSRGCFCVWRETSGLDTRDDFAPSSAQTWCCHLFYGGIEGSNKAFKYYTPFKDLAFKVSTRMML